MLRITDNEIELTRGDECTLVLDVENYKFKAGDTVEFRVYPKKGMHLSPLLSKLVTVEQPSDTVEINLTSQDTKIGEISTKGIPYWYEVELNDSVTVIGYDDEGPKILMLYPEGAEENE